MAASRLERGTFTRHGASRRSQLHIDPTLSLLRVDCTPIAAYTRHHTQMATRQMQKFTTTQLQEALIALRSRSDKDGQAAYAMTWNEVHRRMGDSEFDAWCVAQGW